MYNQKSIFKTAKFLDFALCLVFYITQDFGNHICFHPQVKGWETLNLLVPLDITDLK